ncbi:MAG: molecular chaperone HtpG [Clostridia bacterium]|nr:molecular chaperone HtpG [Clostridia bacterium]
MAKKQFKTESKRILDLMINSIYTHKEIFLREIISNASDAIDKRCYVALTEGAEGFDRTDFKIRVEIDKERRTITVSDNGIGMTREELEENLGTIAKSGSLSFKENLSKDEKDEKEIDIIGQFGVGFYSAFMVAEKVTVTTKSIKSDEAFVWESTGVDGYTIRDCVKDEVGTTIVMYIKPNTEDEVYDEFLRPYRIKGIIKKYSDYVRYPIVMPEEKTVEGTEAKYYEDETINSMVPIWQRNKSDVTDEDCAAFYKETFYDINDPVKVIRINAEGSLNYKAMLFIPSKAPMTYYTKEYQKGLALYTSSVMIMERCEELLPEHFRFVKGVVDSDNLSLNISREILQHDRQLKQIANNLEKKIKSELKKLLLNEREKYEGFFTEFGLQLKYGVVSDYGVHKDTLTDLLLYYSSFAEKMVTLEEYVSSMPESQQYIYYARGESIAKINSLPQTEAVKEKGYGILYLTDDVDEFVVNILGTFMEKEFKNINDKDLGLESDEEKAEAEKKEEENKPILDFVKEALGEEVEFVRLSHKLKSHPVCLASEGEITLEMEKYFKSLPGEKENAIKARRVLELNGDHRAFEALKKAFEEDKEKAVKLCKILYTEALLIADMPIENAVEFAQLVSELM